MAKEPDEPPPEQAASKVDLSTHPIVEKLLGELDSQEQFVILLGYLGPSKIADSIRLYTSLEFLSYYEIPKGGIALTEPSNPEDEDYPTRVFVISTTVLELVQISRVSLQASFLQGSIASAHLPSASGSIPAPIHPLAGAQPAQFCQPGLSGASQINFHLFNIVTTLCAVAPTQPPCILTRVNCPHITHIC